MNQVRRRFRVHNDSPNDANMLKNLHYKISNKCNCNLRFIPYGIQSLSKEGTMKDIIL